MKSPERGFLKRALIVLFSTLTLLGMAKVIRQRHNWTILLVVLLAFLCVQEAKAAPGVEITTGRFTLNAGVGTQSITGVGFQPKAYILFVTKASVDDTDSATGESILSIGMTDGTTQFCMMSGSEDNQATNDVGRRGMTDEVLCSFDAQANQVVDGEANHVSMDADGFTINIGDDFTDPANPLVHYIAFGGDDLSVSAGTVDLADVVDTSVDVTAPGFEPDVVITSFVGVLLDLDGDTSNDVHSFSLGWAVNPDRQASGNQFSMMTAGRDGQTGGDSYSRFDNVRAGTSHRNSAIDASYEIGTFDASGFDVTTRLAAATTNEIMGYLALNLGSANPQVYTTARTARTATGNDVETGAGFQPIFLMGIGSAAVTTTNSNTNAGSMVVGITDGTNSLSLMRFDDDALNPSNNANRVTNTQFMSANSDSGAIDWEATFSSFDSSGWTINYGDAAGAAYQNAFLAIGSSTAGIAFGGSAGSGDPSGNLISGFDIGAAGRDRLVVVFADHESTGTNLTDVTVDGKSCNLVAIADNAVGLGNHQEMWYCDEDDLGASFGPVDVALVGGATTWGTHVHLYTGVYQNGPSDSQIDNTSQAQFEILPAAINIPANGLVVFGAANGESGTYNDADWDTSPTEGTDDGLSPEIEMTEVTDSPPNPNSAVLATSYWISSTGAQTNRLFRARGSIANNRGTGIVASWGEASAGATTTIEDGTSPGNKSVARSTTNNAVDAFTLATDTGTDTVTALTVTFTGTDVNDVAASGVKIYEDNGATPNEWDSNDTLIDTASFSGTTANFTGLNISVTATATQYLVTYDIAAGATTSNTLQGAITAASVSNTLVNNDTTDATLTVSATTYYVRKDGNDSNSGTYNTPAGAWLTIQKAANTMMAGDTVLVQAGTYYEMVQPANSGASGNPITYKAEGTVVIDGQNTRTRSFELIGVNYIVIEGFEHYNVLDDGGTGGNVWLSNSSNVTVKNNIFRDTGRDGVYITGTSANCVVENNLFYGISDDGISPYGTGPHTIRNNTIYDTGGWAIEGADTSANLFENNIIWDTMPAPSGTATWNYNDYISSVLSGTGNISSDPLFISAATDDFHLSQIAAGQGSDSPCKDAGSDTAANLGLETRTTRTDHVTDTGTVDMGFHYPGGGIFQYRKPITIPFGNVGGSCTTYLENFPLLIKITDTDLITKARDDGYDIVFRSLEANTCAPEAAPCGLYHEVERWNSSTGELIAWVKIPRLYHDSDTTIYMYYGNPNVDQATENPTGVWDSSYVGVWHLNETTGSHYDSTSGNNGTPGGGVIQDAIGKIDGANDFDGNDDYVEIGTTGFSTTNMTFSAWVRADALADRRYIFGHTTQPAFANRIQLYTAGTAPTVLGLGLGDTHAKDTGSTLSTGPWYHVVLVKDATNYWVYLNTALDMSGTYTGLSALQTYADIGNDGNPSERTESWNGVIDEVRISDTPRSTCWIETEYANQSDPAGFYNVGLEEGPGVAPAEPLTSFTAKGDGSSVLVEWETAQELNHMGFHLYQARSLWGPFTRLTDKLISSLTSSVVGREYSFEDKDVTPGEIYYYKL